MGSDCQHQHGLVHVHGPTSGRKLWFSLLVTLAFVLLEAGAGYKAHSLALLSDAGHNLSDALALSLAAFAIWIGRRPASALRTFGYHRVAILTALFNAVSLIVLALIMATRPSSASSTPSPPRAP